MTNAEINLEVAVKALNENKLTGAAKNFVESIKDYDKYDLKNLSPKQYKFLADIYRHYS